MNTDINKFITNPCLIAADIDKTLLNRGDLDEERIDFIRKLAPELAQIALLGINIAFVTGNNISQLSTRFLESLIKTLEGISAVEALKNFHFFCNSGGVYIYFGEEDLKKCKKGKLGHIIFNGGDLKQIKSKYINKEYLKKTQIDPADLETIKGILDVEWKEYILDLKKNIKSYQKEYYINRDPVPGSYSSRYPYDLAFDGKDHVDVRYLNFDENSKSTVQITLKPVLSWKHAVNPENKFNNDIRTKLINRIHKRFDEKGLTNYLASSGGNTSIDITKSRLDKAYAIRFLIDHLGIEGNLRKGEKYGSNVIYLGDEVISGGGNDFPVTKIDGVLVLAVNKIPEYVPFKSRVIIPYPSSFGPEASAMVLSEFKNIAQLELSRWSKKKLDKEFPQKNAIQLFKEKWFLSNIKEKIDKKLVEKISAEELKVLHTFISLISRNDESARKLSNILVNELDEIMEALDENQYERLKGIT